MRASRSAALNPGGPDIVTFMMSKDYLEHDFLSVSQVSILKAIYGMEMTREELLAFLEMTEGRKPRKGGYQDVALDCGTRSGKSVLAGGIATYETVKWGPHLHRFLIPGQVATGILVAANRRQAGILRGYIEGNLNTLEEKGFDVLAQTHAQAKAVTGDCIKLRWPVEIVIYTASKASTRGTTGLWFIGDECAWWESSEGAYNQDVEVIRAVRSRFATLAGLRPKRILISSPNTKQGILWDAHEKRASNQALFVKAPTWILNPAVPQEFLDAEQERDPEAFMRDYGAEFQDVGAGNTFLPAEIVDQCVERGRTVVPPAAGIEYLSWMDAAFKRDRFTHAIGHISRASDGSTVVLDLVQHWTPERKGKPLDDGKIVAEIVATLQAYGLDRTHGDQFADIPLKRSFQEMGKLFVECPVSNEEKFDVYKNLRAALRGGMVKLPDDPVVIRDLKGLIKKESPTGKVIICAPKRKGSYDDAASVVSRIVARLLPIGSAIDFAELNAAAVTPRIVDWKDTASDINVNPLDPTFANVMEMTL